MALIGRWTVNDQLTEECSTLRHGPYLNTMHLFAAFSILITLSALFAYINHRYIKLPSVIGLMLLALILSMVLIATSRLFPGMVEGVREVIETTGFSDLLMDSMLGFMLFAGAIHIKLDELKQEKWAVMLLSTVSVITSTLLVGFIVKALLGLFGIEVELIHALLFGSLISPTDPIAVLGILKEAKVPRSLEMKIAGESLFNDGVAVVVFLTLLAISQDPGGMGVADIATLFAHEAGGGILWGLLIGYAGFLLMRSIDNYKIEVLLSLAVVMGGYSFAHVIHVSGPLAMVAAGILIGNHGKELAMSDLTLEYVDKFWELIDEILNAVLFVLIGLELLVIDIDPLHVGIGGIGIGVVLVIRYFSVWLPVQFLRFKQRITRGTLIMLTWGGLRGGISIAMALSLPVGSGRELWITLTYVIVAFSILVQGLTVGRVAKKVKL
ncbi:MAG: sodium:proton antiporter [Flavobacteriales bacterium]